MAGGEGGDLHTRVGLMYLWTEFPRIAIENLGG